MKRFVLLLAVLLAPLSLAGSELQSRVNAAAAGSVVEIGPGTYHGDLVISRPVHLIGRDRPRLIGSGRGTVMSIRADDVIVEGFDIDGLGGGDLGDDASGIHIAARNVTVRDCRVVNALFGIYLREADGAVVDGCTVRGIRGKTPGEKGSGIHVWNTAGYRLTRNQVGDSRDGFYIQSSSHGLIAGNDARDLRYGLHYMYSDDNTFEDNHFENGAAGAAVMFSRRITFRRNRFVHNRGFASVGLLLKACDDIVAEDNLIADNARGIFLEGSYRNTLRRNIIAGSDVAVVLYDSCAENRFEENSFIANLTPLMLVGKRTDTVFHGNYWSENEEPDLDGDGRSDRPYRLSSVFDHLRGNLQAADLFSQSLASQVLGHAERLFPVLDAVPVVDAGALMRPPRHSAAPVHSPSRERSPAGLLTAGIGIAGGLSVFLLNRKSRKARS